MLFYCCILPVQFYLAACTHSGTHLIMSNQIIINRAGRWLGDIQECQGLSVKGFPYQVSNGRGPMRPLFRRGADGA
jgi:hypothetical protein